MQIGQSVGRKKRRSEGKGKNEKDENWLLRGPVNVMFMLIILMLKSRPTVNCQIRDNFAHNGLEKSRVGGEGKLEGQSTEIDPEKQKRRRS